MAERTPAQRLRRNVLGWLVLAPIAVAVTVFGWWAEEPEIFVIGLILGAALALAAVYLVVQAVRIARGSREAE